MDQPNDIKVDSSRAATYHRGDSTGRVRLDGWIWKQVTGTATAGETSFSFDDTIPSNSYISAVAVINGDTSMTATTTVALGYSGTTGAFMAASAFGNTMNQATAKTTTVVNAYLTAAKTPLITLSADLDTGAKLLCGIRYSPAPAIA